MKTLLVLCGVLMFSASAFCQVIPPDTPVGSLTNAQIFAWVLGPRDSTGTVVRALTSAEIDTARAALGFHQSRRDTSGTLRPATWDEFQEEVLSRVKGPIQQWVETYAQWKLNQAAAAQTWGN
jgi:hypothetical protein